MVRDVENSVVKVVMCVGKRRMISEEQNFNGGQAQKTIDGWRKNGIV